MVAVTGKLLPLAHGFSRQIVPPVLATLIAALLIAGFNRAFSTHLVQPRMSAMHHAQGESRPIVYAANPQQEVAVTEVAASGPTVPERIFAKDNAREAGKDQGTLKVAAVPAAAPAPLPRIRKSESAEPRVASVAVVVAPPASAPVVVAPPVAPQRVAPVAQAPIAAPLPPVAAQTAPYVAPQYGAPIAQAPIAAPPPPVAAQPIAPEPPPVITAKPMVTVPDRPRPYPGPGYEQRPSYEQRPAYEQQADDVAPPPREQRPLERFVDAIKPSSIFNRMREFGDRIEAAGNEILPSIRQ